MTQTWQSQPTDGLKGGWVFLPFCLSFSLSLCVSLSPSIYRATFLAIYLSTCLFMYLSIDLFIHLSIKLSIFLPIQPFIHPLTSLVVVFFRPSLHRSMSTAIHHHVLRSVSLSIHPCICPSTSSSSYPSIYLSVGNIKNEAILRDFLTFCSWKYQNRSNSARVPSKMESWLYSWRPRTNAFCDFSMPCL